MKASNPFQSLLLYEQALFHNPRNSATYHNMGVLFTEHPELLNRQRELLSGLSGDASLDCSMGMTGKDRALLCYELACHFSNGTCVEAYNNMGVLFRERGQLDKAVVCFQKVIECRPQCSQTLVNLAALYVQQGRTDEAHKLCTLAIGADPKYAEVRSRIDRLMCFSISFCSKNLSRT